MIFLKRAKNKIFSYTPRHVENDEEDNVWRDNKLKHRVFNYKPRYYNPKDDTEEKRFDFQSHSKLKRRSSTSLVILIILALVIIAILRWQNVI